jgi:ATP-dependent Clp protease ATP-binding subunit ClpA
VRPQSATFSDDLRDALIRAHRQGSSLALLSGLILRIPALRTALVSRGVDVEGVERDVSAQRLSWWQRRRRRRRDLYLVVTRAAADAMDRGERRVGTSDLLRALAKEPEVDAARRLRTAGIDAEQLRRIADELDNAR